MYRVYIYVKYAAVRRRVRANRRPTQQATVCVQLCCAVFRQDSRNAVKLSINVFACAAAASAINVALVAGLCVIDLRLPSSELQGRLKVVAGPLIL